jgi:hypothetical protein
MLATKESSLSFNPIYDALGLRSIIVNVISFKRSLNEFAKIIDYPFSLFHLFFKLAANYYQTSV